MTRHGYSARRTLNESSAAKPSRAGVGLALGGGFARGFAHLGVLQVLEQNHVPISHIAGTSVGSILGAAYASGAPLSRIIETDRKSTRLNSSHTVSSYAVFCLKKKKFASC